MKGWDDFAALNFAALSRSSSAKAAAMLIEIDRQLQARLDPIAIEIDSGLDSITQDALNGLERIEVDVLDAIEALAKRFLPHPKGRSDH